MLKIDRLIANTPENLPFEFMAVGFEGVERIEREQDEFVAYGENDKEIFRLLNFYTVTVTYEKEQESENGSRTTD